MHIETRVTGFIEENCYLVSNPDTQEVVVIDPGDAAADLAARLRGQNFKVVAYLLTHGHVDHISALADLCADFPAPIHIHPADAAWCFTEQNAILGLYPAPRKPDCPLVDATEGMVFELAGASWTVLETPGHTPGCICWKLDAANALFAGDTLFRDSAGRTDLPGGNPRALTQSLRKLAALPDDLRVFSGHGELTTIGREKRENFFMQF